MPVSVPARSRDTANPACRKNPRFPFPYRTGLAAALFALLASGMPAAPASPAVNDGTMTTTFGDGSDKLDLQNNGTITVSGNGMQAGTDSLLGNAGTITVSGANVRGMTGSDGAILMNQASGLIDVNGSDGYGMAVTGHTGNEINDGTIHLNAPYSAGMYGQDTGDTVKSITLVNNGTLQGTAASGTGMMAEGSGTRLVNGTSGLIRMDGNRNNGLVASGDGARVVNDGQITVGGDVGKGIAVSGKGATLTNRGNVTVSGDSGSALEAGNGVQVIQSGKVLVTGRDGTGILSGAGTRIDNSGTVVTTQSMSQAVHGIGSDITVANTGLIQTGGDISAGVYLYGENARIDNRGSIVTHGAASYGLLARQDKAVIDNSGTISTRGNDSAALYLDGHDGTVTQAGLVQTAGSGSHGILINGNGVNATVTANGRIETAGTNSSGISGTGTGTTVVNRGSIATGGDTSHGIVTGGENARIDNSGHIVTRGNAANGLYAWGPNATVANSGDIETQGTQSAGIVTGENAIVKNDGRVAAGKAHAVILGNGTSLINNGRIESRTRYGIYAPGPGSSVVNDGTVETEGDRGRAIVATGEGASIINRAFILTSGASATGIAVSGDGSTVSNTALIVTSGQSADGIGITGQNVAVSSTGRIVVSAGHELMVGNTAGTATGSASVTAWSLALDPNRWRDPASRPFGAGPGSTLTFDHTRFVLRPGSAGSGFEFGKRYNVADMIDNRGTVTGAIGSDTVEAPISGVMPMLKAKLYGSGADGALGQQVSLSLKEEDNHGQASNSGIVHRTAARLWLLNRTLGDSMDNLATAPDWAFFVQPYYQHSRVTGNASSRADSEGLLLGATLPVREGFRLGWHAGIEHTDLSASRHGLKSDIDAWLAGLHGRYTLLPGWSLLGQLTATASRSDYDFSMEDDSASDKRTEHAYFASLKSAWDLYPSAENRLTPEIGLAWLWMRNPSMDALWKQAHNQELNLHFARRDFSALVASADLRWAGQFSDGDTRIRPTLAAGVRQNLDNGHVDSGFTFMGRRYTAHLTEDRTAATAEAGVRFTRNNISGAIRYNGEFGHHFTDHIVWAEFGVAF